MNNKEFIAELSRRMGYTNKDAAKMTASVVELMSEQLQEGNQVTVPGFGTFEVKKKQERVSVNPLTKQRWLIPPKLVLAFKPNTTLKEKFK